MVIPGKIMNPTYGLNQEEISKKIANKALSRFGQVPEKSPSVVGNQGSGLLLECNLCTSFALFTSLNINVLHLIIMIYLCFTFIGAILWIDDKI